MQEKNKDTTWALANTEQPVMTSQQAEAGGVKRRDSGGFSHIVIENSSLSDWSVEAAVSPTSLAAPRSQSASALSLVSCVT